MNLTSPLYFFAIAVAMVSSLATQIYAQAPENVAACEAFTAAIEAQGNATIVSEFTGEEAVSSSFLPSSFVFDNGEVLSAQGVTEEIPELTIPSGTLCLLEGAGPIPENTLT